MKNSILFITNLHLWSLERGKGGRAFINTVEGYKKAGWDIWFVSSGGSVPPNLIAESQLFEKSFTQLDRFYKSKFKLISIFARFFKQFMINRFYKKVGTQVLKNSGRNFVIYSYEVHSVSAGKYLSKKFNRPLVTRFQGSVHSETVNTFLNRIKKTPYLKAYSTDANLTIMTNDGTKGKEVLKRFKNASSKVLFWRNGVNKVPQSVLDRREQLRNKYGFDDDFVFLTVSRLVNWKRVDRAIKGFSELLQQGINTNCKLVIIGDGAEMENLRRLVTSLKLDNYVSFLGAIEQKEIYEYMVAADVFLSLYDLSNVGNPLMEAMMCGKPIITLDVGDTKELIEDGENGILLTKETLNLLTEKMTILIEDDNFRKKIANNAFNYACKEFWDWDNRILAEIDEVEKLLK